MLPLSRVLPLVGLLCGLLLGPCVVFPARAALAVNGDGTVTDTATGLVWDRCVLGLGTTTTACDTGTAALYEWAQALVEVTARNAANHLGHGDWRLPNKNELESLVDPDVHTPAIDATAFPHTPTTGDSLGQGAQWTSSPTGSTTDPGTTWMVSFLDGIMGMRFKTFNNGYVRLVRGGQAFAAFDSLLPTVHGACGSAQGASPPPTSAPAADLCGAGSTASGVTTGASAYTWSCAGSNGGTTASCSATRGYTITASAGVGGAASCTPNPVGHGGTAACAATPNSGYVFSGWSGDCSGSGACTLSNVTGPRAVTASFALSTSYSGAAPTGSGSVSVAMSGGGPACGFASVGHRSAASVAPVPGSLDFPHGVVAFTTSTCAAGGTVSVTLTYPQPIPANARFYKYGPPAAGQPSQWYQHPAVISGNTVIYDVTDGGAGDGNPAAGVISDPGGIGVPGVSDIPTLSEWALAWLALLLAGSAAHVQLRRRPASADFS